MTIPFNPSLMSIQYIEFKGCRLSRSRESLHKMNLAAFRLCRSCLRMPEWHMSVFFDQFTHSINLFWSDSFMEILNRP